MHDWDCRFPQTRAPISFPTIGVADQAQRLPSGWRGAGETIGECRVSHHVPLLASRTQGPLRKGGWLYGSARAAATPGTWQDLRLQDTL